MISTEQVAVRQFFETLQNNVSTSPEGDWGYSLSVSHTIFRGENMLILSFDLQGKGLFTQGTPTTLTIEYRLNESLQSHVFQNSYSEVDSAITALFSFTKDYTVCLDCGELILRPAICVECEFFKKFGWR